MYNHNKAQQSKNRVHISWDILYLLVNVAIELSRSNARVSGFPPQCSLWENHISLRTTKQQM